MQNGNQSCKNCKNFEMSTETCLITKLKVNKDASFQCISYESKPSVPSLIQVSQKPELELSPTISSVVWSERDSRTQITSLMKKEDKKSPLDLEKLKKFLKKRSGIVEFGIEQNKAFQILINQFKAFELKEIQEDKTELTAIYSGFAPILNNEMIAELKVKDSKAELTIWARDVYQSFGILNFLKNSLKILFDSSSKFEGQSLLIDQKLSDFSLINNHLRDVFNDCKQGGKIISCIENLTIIKTKINNNFPELDFINEIESWIDDLNSINLKDVDLQKDMSKKLEYNLLYWLFELNKIIRYDYETYREIYSEDQTEKIYKMFEDSNSLFDQIEFSYLNRILQFLMVLTKGSGVTLYSFDFSEDFIDANLLSGFLSAIKMFGGQFTKGSSPIVQLQYDNFQIALYDQENITGAMILDGIPTQKAIQKLKDFTNDFLSQFREEIINFRGNVSLFNDAEKIKEKIFT